MKEFIKHWGIGLTGGIATGKSSVARFLSSLGFIVFDADNLAREVVEPSKPALKELVQTFGSGILSQDKSLDRKKLRSIVFKNEEKRRTLEQILHPAIQALLEEKLRRSELISSPRYWFYEASLLCETGRDRDFKELWLTDCSYENQLARTLRRDKVSSQAAKRVLAAQMPPEEKKRRAHFIINTDQSPLAVENLIRKKIEDSGLNLRK
ncbi:MAG: dephospho-CoA kinase [Oligoflexales bacterium]|nr:dephospho-CoA kinase [Oligoflexales bacterium]